MKQIHSIFLYFLMIWFISFPLPTFGANRALLVGIEDYANLPASTSRGRIQDLKGSLTDVQLIKEILTKTQDYSYDSIKILTEDKATKRNIVETFNKWLIQGTVQGDAVFFFFSGHGTSVTDQNGDEDDGIDEGLCPYDIQLIGGKNLLLDDELGDLLRALRGRDVVVMLDACYSGGMTRSAQGKPVSRPEETPARIERFCPITDYQPSYFPKAILVDEPEGCLFITAALENQVALETNKMGRFCGAFTYGVSDAFRSGTSITYKEVYEHARKVVKDVLELPQDPQIKPKNSEIISRVAFGIRVRQPVERNDFTEPVKINVRIELSAPDQDIQTLGRHLSKLPYVDIVTKTQNPFDRLIRGEMRNNQYKVRLLNQIGDVFPLPRTRNIETLTKDIIVQLEYAYMLKQLVSLRHPAPPFKVTLEPAYNRNRRNFFLGEEIAFTLTSEKDGYLLLISLDAKSNFHILFPNQYHMKNIVKANQKILLPDEIMRKNNFILELGPPAGREVVKAIVTTSPIRLENLGLGQFAQHFDGLGRIPVPKNKISSFIKGLGGSTQGTQWSEDILVLRSYPK